MPRVCVEAARISKRQWYAAGGFANPRCFRKANKAGAWRYYFRYDGL